MALYVVLSIEDETHAKDLVKNIIEDGFLPYRVEAPVPEYPNSTMPFSAVTTKVEGVFKKPTKFCDPTDTHRNNVKKHMGWVRGRRYGWNVCSVCGKPNKGFSRLNAWVSALGVNLLPRTTYMPNEMPMNWDQSPAMWNDLTEIMGGSIPHPMQEVYFGHLNVNKG